MKNENQRIKKNIKKVIDSLTKNLLRLHFEVFCCNAQTQKEILFSIDRLNEAREALQMLMKSNSISKFDL